MIKRIWSRHVIIVQLPPEPRTGDEIDRVIQLVVNDSTVDIIVDFADVQTLHQLSICRILILQRLLHKYRRNLGFCSVSRTVRSVFKEHRMGQFVQTDLNTEISLEPLVNPKQGGNLLFGNQGQIETCERRRYVRYSLSKSLSTTALLWHRVSETDKQNILAQYWPCTLVDVSEGGVQVVMDFTQEPTFYKAQFVSVRFAPVAWEMPITFDAIVREILPTADNENICLGLQFVGLEANTKGRSGLKRLCDSEGRYFEAVADVSTAHPALKPRISSS